MQLIVKNEGGKGKGLPKTVTLTLQTDGRWLRHQEGAFQQGDTLVENIGLHWPISSFKTAKSDHGLDWPVDGTIATNHGEKIIFQVPLKDGSQSYHHVPQVSDDLINHTGARV